MWCLQEIFHLSFSVTTKGTKKPHCSPKLYCTCQSCWKSRLLCLTQLLLATASHPCSLTDAFSLGVSLLLLPGAGRNELSDLHCLATQGAAAGASYTAAALGSRQPPQQLSPVSRGFTSGTGSKRLRLAVHMPGNRTHSEMWYKPSSPLAF